MLRSRDHGVDAGRRNVALRARRGRGLGWHSLGAMRGPVLIAVGALIAVMGSVFFVQGIGVLGGSMMTGDPLWAVLGPLIAIGGLVVVVLGVRTRRR